MSNFTNNTQAGFSVIKNDIFNCKDLSFEVKGIYCFLISKPTGWSFSAKKISSQTKESEGVVKRLLKELEAAGLLIRTKTKGDTGLFNGVKYEVVLYENQENTSDCSMVTKSTNGESTIGKSISGKSTNIRSTNNRITNYSNTNKENSETLFSEFDNLENKETQTGKQKPTRQSEEAEYKKMLMTEAGVSEEVIDEYIVLRKRKKASLGKIAATRLIKEIKKCPLPPDEIIGKCLERGWVGFEASWLMPKPQNNNFGGNNNGGSFDVNNPGFQTNR